MQSKKPPQDEFLEMPLSILLCGCLLCESFDYVVGLPSAHHAGDFQSVICLHHFRISVIGLFHAGIIAFSTAVAPVAAT